MLACGRAIRSFRSLKTSAIIQFKSVYNLENIYPNSSLNYGGLPKEFSDSSPKKFSGDIPISKLTIKYSKASGPGGQHVNKTSSKAEVRFLVETADWIPEDVKLKLLAKYKNKVNRNGELIVHADQSRYQLNNLKICLDKIKSFIEEVEKPPDSKKEELLEQLYSTDKIHAAQRKRLQRKRIKSATKSMRSGLD